MEPKHLITMSLGKIQACRIKRGGPSLHKSLMVSAILHKAKNILMNDIYIQARKVEMYEEEERRRKMAENQETNEIAEIVEPPRPETPLPTAEEEPASHAMDAAKKARHENTCNKENNPPINVSTEPAHSHTEIKAEGQSNMEYRDSSDSNKCAKRRLSESCDNENIPPKRIRSENPATESTDNNNASAGQECSQPQCSQQISCLVQRFNSGLNGLFTSQKCNSGPLQDSQGHNEVVSNCCATQLTKDFSEQMSRPVIALTV